MKSKYVMQKVTEKKNIYLISLPTRFARLKYRLQRREAEREKERRMQIPRAFSGYLEGLTARGNGPLTFRRASDSFVNERMPLTFVPIVQRGVSIHVSIHRLSGVTIVKLFHRDYVINTRRRRLRRSSAIRTSLIAGFFPFNAIFEKNLKGRKIIYTYGNKLLKCN